MAVRAFSSSIDWKRGQEQGPPDAPLGQRECEEHCRKQHNDFGAYLHEA